MTKLYSDLAAWYPLFTHFSDYDEEASFFTNLLAPAAATTTLLELGCGQGANAKYMKSSFDITLVDVSEAMLELSRALNPELRHLTGDMRTLRLGVTFDRVFIHDAVSYLTTRDELAQTFETVNNHLTPGGIALLAPDYLKDNFVPGWDDGGHDGPDGRGVRFVEHCQDPDPADDTYQVDYAIMLRHADGRVQVEHDTHTEGLFSRQTWLDLATSQGLQAETVVFDHSELDHVYELILCRKP